MSEEGQQRNQQSTDALRSGDPAAAALIWNWKDANKLVLGLPNRRTKGIIQGIAGLTAGTMLYVLISHHIGMVVWTIASVITFCAFVSPHGAYAAIERFIDWLVGVVGKSVTYLVMVPIFYLIFLPFGMLFRTGKKDAMKPFYEESAESYWLTRVIEVTPEDRERLF
jgi:hypothetical protein